MMMVDEQLFHKNLKYLSFVAFANLAKFSNLIFSTLTRSFTADNYFNFLLILRRL